MDERRLEARLDAVERAVTDGEPIPELAEAAEAADDAASRERRIDDLEERVAELEAATQALRGYVGNVRSVNEGVEERADAALARTEDLEARVAAIEGADDDDPGGDPPAPDDAGSRPASGPSSDRPSGAPSLSSTDDPAWLAAADDRLPGEESPTETEPEGSDDGLAARLGGLL